MDDLEVPLFQETSISVIFKPCHENWSVNLLHLMLSLQKLLLCFWLGSFQFRPHVNYRHFSWFQPDGEGQSSSTNKVGCPKLRWQGLFLQQTHSLSECGDWTVHELIARNKCCMKRSLRMLCVVKTWSVRTATINQSLFGDGGSYCSTDVYSSRWQRQANIDSLGNNVLAPES